MQGAILATNLLGRPVRFNRAPDGAESTRGTIVTVYTDGRGIHYIVEVDGRLVDVADAAVFTLVEEPTW